jgi:hypothetical protein
MVRLRQIGDAACSGNFEALALAAITLAISRRKEVIVDERGIEAS